jgi:serine/threonine protein kinase
MISKTILHYKILEKLGSGGMGIVYKAQDTKLDRFVALKFLSLTTIGDEEKKRFKREAKAAASLNHPNIATIFAIDETDEQTFIAMEYIEGQSLQEIIGANGGSPMPLNDAINYASRIAAGLQAAHEKGIVHRDIKSANIMVTDKGQVKIMDFGLAKLANRSMMTAVGTTLGTTAYMSPEQARGEEVDNRSDIWSLGVVLYEMISGQIPFNGDYEQAVIYSIQNEDPEPLTALRTGVPMALERVVNKAMAKSPNERYQHVDEMLVDLRTLKKKLSSLMTKTSTGSPAFYKHKRKRWQSVVPWSITIMAVGAAIVLWSPWQTTSLERPLMRFVHSLPPGQTIENVESFGLAMSLSPDGSQLVYTGTDSGGGTQLYRRPIDQFEFTPIPSTEGAGNPFFSPDGRWVGFFAEGKLKKVSLMGGAPISLCEAQSGYGASWGADETIIFSPAFTSGLFRVSATGGTPQIITNLKSEQGEISHRWPEILPDGKSVLFTINTGMDADDKRIAILSLETGERRVLVKDGTHARYASAGYLIYLRAGSLLAAPFDVELLEVTGPAVRVLDGVKSSGAGGGYYSFSRNGSFVWVPAAGLTASISEFSSAVSLTVAESALLWVDRRGQTQQLLLPSRHYWGPSFSPDGRRLALTIDLDIFILDLDRGALTRFTFEGRNHIPIWTSDGQRLTFSSARKGHPNLFWKMADGSGIAEQLLTSKQHQDPGSWSPDGKIMAYAELHPETNWDIWLLRMEDERRSEPFLQTRFNEYHPMISPDGRWLAYSSDESGRLEVYVRPFPDGRGKWLISTEGGREPLWARDGEELFYRTGGKLMTVAIETESSFVAGKPRLLFEWEFDSREMTPFGSPNYDVSPDGRFLMIKPDPSPPSAQINFILNWFEELKRLVPSKN